MAHVCVIGAGIIGLQTALSLLQSGYKVTIIATHSPGDHSPSYTSPWAGAHWRTHATADDHRQQEWDLATYNHWRSQIAASSSSDENLGLKTIESRNYWQSDPGDLWWQPHVQSFHPIPPLGTSTKSISFEAIAVNVPLHLSNLRSSILSLGGTFTTADLPSPLPAALHELESLVKADIVVNATGLGARTLVPDPAVHPVKGQTVLVKGEAQAIRTFLYAGGGGIAYVIPRPGSGTSILGGTKEKGVHSADVDDVATERILARARELAPELLTGEDGGFEVLSVQVGFRPAREGGARMEIEEVDGFKVVHAYGHDGAGYQNSIGVAEDVVRMVKEALTQKEGVS